MNWLTNYVKYMSLLLLYSSIYVGAQEKNIQVSALQQKESPAENRYAFIVGIDHYADSSISSLSSCRLDAVRFGSFLKSASGWEVPKRQISIQLDVEKEQLQKEFIRLLEQIKTPELSTLYFYYSGHGVRGSMVPSDFKKENPQSLVSYAWIKNEISKRGIKAQVFVIDACYSGSIITMKDPLDFNDLYLQELAKSTDESFAVFTAANAYRVTPAEKHESLYSKYFLKSIEDTQTDTNGDGVLTAGEVFNSVNANLEAISAPQFAGNKNFPMASLQNHLANRTETYAKETFTTKNQLLQWRDALDERTLSENDLTAKIVALKENPSSGNLAKLGFLFREGIGVSQDSNEALKYFVTAAAEGDAFALYNLGYFHSKGIGLKKDLEKARDYYLKAAEKGNPYAQHNLGGAYGKRNGELCPYNFKKAIYWLEKAAHQGYSNSQTALGQLYHRKADWTSHKSKKQTYYEMAVQWYTKASKSNHALAQYQLAHCYEFGKGTNKDVEASKYWYKEACSNDVLQSCKKLLVLANL